MITKLKNYLPVLLVCMLIGSITFLVDHQDKYLFDGESGALKLGTNNLSLLLIIGILAGIRWLRYLSIFLYSLNFIGLLMVFQADYTWENNRQTAYGILLILNFLVVFLLFLIEQNTRKQKQQGILKSLRYREMY